jgi:hypothetical protein
VDIKLIPLNKEQEKVERPFKLGELYFKIICHGFMISKKVKTGEFSS